MPVVFVHGVNTRKGPGYDKARAARDALFQQVFLPSAGLEGAEVFNPYWGGDGAAFAFGLGCVPTGRESVLQLGPAGDASFAALAAAATAAVPERPREDALVLALARENFVVALDALYAAAVHSAAGDDEAEMAAFAAHLADYALAHEHKQNRPPWLDEVRHDSQFISRLQRDVATASESTAVPVEGLGLGSGVWDRVREGADHLRQEAGAFLGKPAWNAIRGLLVPTVPMFLGDIFVYLKARGTAADPGPIATTVISTLHDAAKQRTADDPLIVVGHSLGGVIAYDLLSGFNTGLTVDLFCSVGSQVALFEEMKAFAASDPAITSTTGRTVDKPVSIADWINVFDYNDVLSYKLKPVFGDVVDYDYPTGDLLHAHGAYFDQPSFHRRLGSRAREVLAP